MEEQCSTREPQQPFFEKVYQIRKTTFDDGRVDLIGERNLNELGNSIAVDLFPLVNRFLTSPLGKDQDYIPLEAPQGNRLEVNSKKRHAPPGFTVTGSISIGRQGWYLKTSAETSDHE